MIQELLTIIGLAITAWQAATTGGAKATADLAATLEQLAAKAVNAYQAQTGQPINPALLNPIDPLP